VAGDDIAESRESGVWRDGAGWFLDQNFGVFFILYDLFWRLVLLSSFDCSVGE
jgi:hypothetical protein